jgi:cyanate lyase
MFIALSKHKYEAYLTTVHCFDESVFFISSILKSFGYIPLHIYYLNRGQPMNKLDVTEAIFAIKKEKELSWQGIADVIDMSVVWTTSACLGMNSCPEPEAEKLVQVLGLPTEAKAVLMEYPTKEWDKAVPQDPLVYRLYEMVGVYGDTLKEVIQEKFGDGIMSAIDFSMDVEKEENSNGDRVVLTLNGKFLPYKSW